MIPAVLSCLFVIYLYRTLNQPDAAAPGFATGADGDQDVLNDIAARLAALETRLRKLAERRPPGRPSP
jgi:hypothetical protein